MNAHALLRILLAFVLVVLLTPFTDDADSVTGTGSDAWPMYRGNAERTGIKDVDGPSGAPVERWRVPIGENQWMKSSPAVADGVAITGGGNGVVIAVNAETGALLWRFAGLAALVPAENQGNISAPEAVFSSAPAIVDGVVYIGGAIEQSGAYRPSPLFAIDAATGQERWRFETGSVIFSSPVVVDGIVYVGSNDGNLYALDAQSGIERWRFDAGDDVDSSPAVNDGVVYVSSRKAVFALDARDGTKRWVYDAIAGSPTSVAIRDGAVYFGAAGVIGFGTGVGHLYALDSATGAERWHREIEDVVASAPAVTKDTIYFGLVHEVDPGGVSLPDDDSGLLLAVDASTGQERWRLATNGRVNSAPSIAGNTLYFGSNDGVVHAVDSESGIENWHVTIGGRVLSSPAIANGMLFVASDLGLLIGLGALQPPGSPIAIPAPVDSTSSIKDEGGWPAFRGGPSRSGEPTGEGPGPVGAPQIAWQTDGIGTGFSSPAVVNGVVYVGVGNERGPWGAFIALDSDSGDVLWRFNVQHYFDSSPAVSDNVVYVAGSEALYALDAADGSELWNIAVTPSSSPVIAGKTVYLGTSFGIVAVDALTGTEKWYSELGSRVWSTPAVAGETVYVASSRGAVFALDAATGAERWRSVTGGTNFASPIIVDGVVYVGSGAPPRSYCDPCLNWGIVVAIDAASGTERWRFETSDWVYSSPAVGAGVVFAASVDGTVYALDAATGIEQWRSSLGAPSGSSPALVDGVLYIGRKADIGAVGGLSALDARTGTERWRVDAASGVTSSPAVADGYVYFVDVDGLIYAIGGASS